MLIRSRVVLSTVALFTLGVGPCAQDIDLGVGAFEVGPTSALLWTHVVPEDPDQNGVVMQMKLATDPGFDNVVKA